MGYWRDSKLHSVCFQYNTKSKYWIQMEYRYGQQIQIVKEEYTDQNIQMGEQLKGLPKLMEPYEDIKKFLFKFSSNQFFEEWNNNN